MRVSLILLTFNQANYVREAIEAAFAQTLQPLEIIISDDASTDGTWNLIQDAAARYTGPHSVRLNRNAANLGVGAHTDAALRMASGDIAILAAGDDISLPSRAEQVAQAFADPAVTCVAHRMVTPRGVESPVPPGYPDANSAALAGRAIGGAAVAYRREVMLRFAPLPGELRSCEDIVMPFRAAVVGKIALLDAPLVEYREHAGSLMGETRNAKPYAAGLKRMISSIACARALQIADLQFASRMGIMTAARSAEIAAGIIACVEREEPLRRILFRQRGGITAAVKATLTGRITISEAIKAVAMGLAPAQWGRYQTWRGRHG